MVGMWQSTGGTSTQLYMKASYQLAHEVLDLYDRAML